MAHVAGSDELREQLALYALDMLPEDESSGISAHLAEGCPACEAELDILRETLGHLAHTAAVQPPSGLKDRVMAEALPRTDAADQVWKRWQSTAQRDVVCVRAVEGPWQPVAPGVAARALYVDPDRNSATMLVRMEPGSAYSAHRHAGAEQCFVLEGDINDGERTYHAGDFQCKAPGSVHGIQSSQNGCLLLIVSSLNDELLA
jgi:anti-sigma factor ChrR (cupin superfamily)